MNARSEGVDDCMDAGVRAAPGAAAEMPVARHGARRKTREGVPVGTSSAFSKRNAADMGISASAAVGS